jgi:hypothetical protein
MVRRICTTVFGGRAVLGGGCGRATSCSRSGALGDASIIGGCRLVLGGGCGRATLCNRSGALGDAAMIGAYR